jgi:hypothetical protein
MHRRLRITAGAGLAAAIVGCTAASLAPATAATASTRGWNLTALRPPAGYPVSLPTAVSCGGGTCVVGGQAMGAQPPQIPLTGVPYFVASESRGRWSRESIGIEPSVAPPYNAADSAVNVTGIACPGTGSCVAVGTFHHAHPYAFANPTFIAVQEHGSWSRAFLPVLPLSATYPPVSGLTAVTCTSPGNCVVIGWWDENDDAYSLMAEPETAGGWSRAVQIYLAPGLGPGTDLASVSCSQPGDCVAVGQYVNPATPAQQPTAVAAIESGGQWGTAGVIRVPKGYRSPAGLTSVSCQSSGTCFALGPSSTGPTSHPMVVTLSHGRWGKPVPLIRSPRGVPAGSEIVLGSISCARTFCLAAGSYVHGADRHWLVVRVEDGKWQRAAQIPVPAPASLTAQGVAGVSCSAGGFCAVAGYYTDLAGDYATLVATAQIGATGA